MSLDNSQHYTYRMGSDNQIRFHWTGKSWRYEFLAGGVLFDEQIFSSEDDLAEALIQHGLQISDFAVDINKTGEAYSQTIQKKMAELKSHGVEPCAKHGLSAKNIDGTCEACVNIDYPDDFKGQEG